jgi:hypothetical protein
MRLFSFTFLGVFGKKTGHFLPSFSGRAFSVPTPMQPNLRGWRSQSGFNEINIMAEKKNKTPSTHALADRPDYVQNIGMVALEAVDLELRLASLFARMIGIKIRVAQAIYLSPKAEQARMDIIRNAAKATYHTKPSDTGVLSKQKQHALTKVERLLARSEKLIRQRHRVIHDEWNISEKEKEVTRRIVGG